MMVMKVNNIQPKVVKSALIHCVHICMMVGDTKLKRTNNYQATITLLEGLSISRLANEIFQDILPQEKMPEERIIDKPKVLTISK